MHAAGEHEVRRPAMASRPVAALLRRLRSRLASLRRPTRAETVEWLAAEFETEAKARSAFFFIPIGLMIGIAITDGAGFRLGFVPALVATVPLLALAHRLGGRGLSGASMLILAFVFAGMTLALAEIRWTSTTIFSGEATVRIEGRVTWRDRDERDRMRYLVRIERTERPALSRPPETAAILVSSRHEPIPVGGRFAGLVRLRAPSGPVHPGAYDFAFAPFFEGRGANGFALGPPEPPDPDVASPTLGERLVRLRLAMSDRIRDVIGGGAGAVASALMTGERSGIPDDINDWLRATGLSHVLSISGLHMALVAGFAMVLVRGLLASIPGAALTLPTKKIAAVAALLVASGYLAISGSDVAADRSYVMLAIMLIAILVDRPALTLRNVAIAAIVVMLTTPHAVVTASFQMSFAATTALVGLYGAMSRRRAKQAGTSARRHPALVVLLFLAGLAVSSAIAGTATAPYAAYHFQRVAPYGVIANLVAVPIFSFWIMPLALIAALLMPFGLDAPFLILIGWALDLVFALAEALAALLPDAPSGRLTVEGLLVLTATLLLACLPASRLRWSAVPLGLVGLLILPDRSLPPELLVYEDGRELATIDAAGHLQPLRPRPNDFVLDQWTRAFPARPPEEGTPPTSMIQAADAAEAAAEPASTTAFRCEATPLPAEDAVTPAGNASTAPEPNPPAATSAPSKPADQKNEASRETHSEDPPSQPHRMPDPLPPFSSTSPKAETITSTRPAATQNGGEIRPAATPTATSRVRKPPPPRQICRATTRSGLRIAWTDDYRLVGLVCDSADIAIVARAVALRTCRSGARLVTLRTLRETGSLAVSRDPAGHALIDISITDPDAPWNGHRRAPWPEFWRNPDRNISGAASKPTTPLPRPFADEAEPERTGHRPSEP